MNAPCLPGVEGAPVRPAFFSALPLTRRWPKERTRTVSKPEFLKVRNQQQLYEEASMPRSQATGEYYLPKDEAGNFIALAIWKLCRIKLN
jgi:hypothetical protein